MEKQRTYKQLIEWLANMEHQQWIAWSKNIINSEKISEDRMDRWAGLWKDYNKLTTEQKEQNREWAEKIIDEMPFKCPMYQCGGIMKAVERKYPKGKNEDDFPDGMVGDFQIPDLICTNCKVIYSFTKFKRDKHGIPPKPKVLGILPNFI
jgi:hypothetical protein